VKLLSTKSFASRDDMHIIFDSIQTCVDANAKLSRLVSLGDVELHALDEAAAFQLHGSTVRDTFIEGELLKYVGAEWASQFRTFVVDCVINASRVGTVLKPRLCAVVEVQLLELKEDLCAQVPPTVTTLTDANVLAFAKDVYIRSISSRRDIRSSLGFWGFSFVMFP
jgi:hypothetical protein